ncbi:MAG TPA: orotate phosphoribosyltransferase [Gammaproteobacteria bacterium]|nr:orotate phosphoribosyltransferase [Gammaproteobacteria bacterium]
METYQREFIEFALHYKALLFGEFTLKSGRKSPYFFNMGCFNTGQAIAKLGWFYATAIRQAQVEYDVLFGPAYKGIPLVTGTAIALAEHYAVDKPYCFNRKEAKNYGEGGMIVGAPLAGRVLMIDDVISAGVTVHEVIRIVHEAGASLAAIAISVDRQERGMNQQSAVEEVEQKHHIPVIPIIRLKHVLEYLKEVGKDSQLERMLAYRAQYGV